MLLHRLVGGRAVKQALLQACTKAWLSHTASMQQKRFSSRTRLDFIGEGLGRKRVSNSRRSHAPPTIDQARSPIRAVLSCRLRLRLPACICRTPPANSIRLMRIMGIGKKHYLHFHRHKPGSIRKTRLLQVNGHRIRSTHSSARGTAWPVSGDQSRMGMAGQSREVSGRPRREDRGGTMRTARPRGRAALASRDSSAAAIGRAMTKSL